MRALWWILGILGVFLLFVLLTPVFTGNQLLNPAGAPQTGQEPSPIGPITDILALVDPVDPTPIVGRDVALADVSVAEVVNDSSFWVGPADNQRVFVVHNQGNLDLRTGDRVSLLGTVLLTPPVAEAMEMWDLPRNQEDLLQGERIYVDAERVQKVE